MEQKVTVPEIVKAKASGRPIVALTAYDFPFARIADEAGVDLILVGDSLGMVVQGTGYDVAGDAWTRWSTTAAWSRAPVAAPCWSPTCRSSPTRSARSRRSPMPDG